MRYFLTGLVMMFAVSVWAADGNYNETVAAISYNPSRLGAYSHLKIAKTAKLKGGVEAPEGADVNIMTKGTVNVKNGGNCISPQACHQIGKIASLAGSGYTNSNFENEEIEANFTATLQTESGTLVQGGNTPYQGEIKNINDNDDYNVPFPSSATGTNLELSGGTLSTASGSNVFVKNLDATLTQLHLEAGTLIMNQKPNANNEYAAFRVNNNATFKVGNTSIDASSSPSCGNNCKFSWQERVDKGGTKARVLAIHN